MAAYRVGDKLISNRGAQSCVIIEAPVQPARYLVIYESGFKRRWGKRHLNKYYNMETKND